MVGLFINTLPLRARAEPSARLVPWLAALQERQAAAREHEWSPLADVQGWSEVPRGSALFDSILVFENYPIDECVRRPFAGVRLGGLRSIERTNYALTLAVQPGDSLDLAASAPRGRFEPGGVTRILGCLCTLLDTMVARPDARLAELQLLGADERGAVLARASGPSVRVDGERCIHELVREQAQRTPDAEALICGNESLTYAELVRRSGALAHRLRAPVSGRTRWSARASSAARRGRRPPRGPRGGRRLSPAQPRARARVPGARPGPRSCWRRATPLTSCRHPRLRFGTSATRLRDRSGSRRARHRRTSPASLHLRLERHAEGRQTRTRNASTTSSGAAACPRCPRRLRRSRPSASTCRWEVFAPLAGALARARAGRRMDPAYSCARSASGITVLDFVPSLLSVFLVGSPVDAPRRRARACGGGG
jgi:hypothetical protein